MTIQEVIGWRVTEFRKLHGLTQAELAKRSGVSRQTVSNIERGVVDATVSTLYALAQALGEPLSRLMMEPLGTAWEQVLTTASAFPWTVAVPHFANGMNGDFGGSRTVQSCGHGLDEIVSSGEGTSYCGRCAEDAAAEASRKGAEAQSEEHDGR